MSSYAEADLVFKSIQVKNLQRRKYRMALQEIVQLMAELQADMLKCCETCDNWQGGCSLVDGKIPPLEVIASGCEQWNEGVPF